LIAAELRVVEMVGEPGDVFLVHALILHAPTIKQHLAALRKLFDYLTIGGILETNPANSVRGPN
jgi:site-specific recombinase XerC